MNNKGGNYNNWGAKRGGRGRGGGRGPWRPQGGYRGQSQGSYRGRGGHYGKKEKPWNNRPIRDAPGKRLSEEDIGVTEYVSNHQGFQGIIKSRYSDFQVAEINEQGEVARLTDLTVPTAPTEATIDEDEDLLLNKYNVEILPMDTWDRINTLAVSEASSERVEVDVSGLTKEQRTKIHDAVKKAFGDSIVGSTVTVEDKKLVRFERFRKGVRIDNRVKWVWPGEYVHFIVYKENCDTMEAATKIAERLGLHLKPSMLGYAGTKDRRAKTSQWFSLRKVDPRKIAAAGSNLRPLRIGNYSFSDKHLKLGMLKGNEFRIALRNITAPDAAVEAACKALVSAGFLNYYGLQRFGQRAHAPTYKVGLHLLRGQFKEAVDLILSGDGEGSGGLEGRLRRALHACPTDALGAINKLARNTRLLYVHSYQSLVWNRAATRRWKEGGNVPVVGDLVALEGDGLGDESIPIDEGLDYDSDEEQDGDSTQDGGDKDLPKTNLETSTKEKPKIPVKILTQEDIDSGKYSIFDVVLPLPGNAIEYPPNMKDYYEELLTKDGLTLEMKQKIRSYSMSGAYRPLLARPARADWRELKYSDPNADLLLSDWDTMQKRELKGVQEDGKYRALVLTITLPASCYATMALRELLRVDTSSDKQAMQNNYHKETKTEKQDGDIQERPEKRKIEDGESEAKRIKQEDD